MKKTNKFFNEAGGGHYDIRFYWGKVETKACQEIILDALEAFYEMCNIVNVKPILMHGGLIGWYWNQRLLPWDDDIDVCITHDELIELEKMTQTLDSSYDKQRYLFEINPNHHDRTTLNLTHRHFKEPNKIDARFINKKTGLFLDITALSHINGKLSTKCPHVYHASDIFPLQSSELNGRKVYLPSNVSSVLIQEYGPDVLKSTTFKEHFFDVEKKLWEPVVNSKI